MSEDLQNEEKVQEPEIVETVKNKNEGSTDTKNTYTAGLVIGILSIVFGVFFALVGDILGIIGIILNATKRKDFNTTAGLVLSIIGLVIAICNNIIGAILAVALYSGL